MKTSEAFLVLGACASVDRRTVGEADGARWADLLDDIPVDVALRAVTLWYRGHPGPGETGWIYPSHIRALAEQIMRAAAIEAQRRHPAPCHACGGLAGLLAPGVALIEHGAGCPAAFLPYWLCDQDGRVRLAPEPVGLRALEAARTGPAPQLGGDAR